MQDGMANYRNYSSYEWLRVRYSHGGPHSKSLDGALCYKISFLSQIRWVIRQRSTIPDEVYIQKKHDGNPNNELGFNMNIKKGVHSENETGVYVGDEIKYSSRACRSRKRRIDTRLDTAGSEAERAFTKLRTMTWIRALNCQ